MIIKNKPVGVLSVFRKPNGGTFRKLASIGELEIMRIGTNFYISCITHNTIEYSQAMSETNAIFQFDMLK